MELFNTHSGPAIEFDGITLVLSEIKSVSKPILVHTVSTFNRYAIVVEMKNSNSINWFYKTDIKYPNYNDAAEVQKVIDALMVYYNALMGHWKL